jgi:hypothetical protein
MGKGLANRQKIYENAIRDMIIEPILIIYCKESIIAHVENQ